MKTERGPIRMYDRSGEEYAPGSLQVPRVSRSENTNDCADCSEGTMDIGIFRLYFMDIINDTGHGFDEDAPLCANRKQVICQVFTDLSNFISVQAGVPRVNVRIDASGVLNLSGAANPLAFASSFYVMHGGVSEGIIDGETWKSINGDEDPYLSYPPALLPASGLATPGNAGYFHGTVKFFFPENAEYYHTDFTTLPPAGKIDMYTVTLHEVMHMLGFASLIGQSGASKLVSCPECYSRYDSYLKFESTGQPVIGQTPGSGGTCADLNYTGPASMATGCTNGVIFDGQNNQNQEVFSPATWSDGSSLSHFDCADNVNSCPFQNSQNVMVWCNQGGPDFTRRHPSQAEANTFCDLGYSRGDSWGDAANATIYKTYASCVFNFCNHTPVAYNDYQNSAGQPYVISNTAGIVNPINIVVTNNDVNLNAVWCVEIASGPGTVQKSPDNEAVVKYTPPPTAFSGYVVLKYRGYTICGNQILFSNDAYVFIRVVAPPTCPQDDCNLICGGDFEATPYATAYSDFWLSDLNNSPDMYRRGTDGVVHRIDFEGMPSADVTIFAGCNQNVLIPNTYSPSSNSYIGFFGYHPANPAIAINREGLMFELNQSMQPGHHYTLKFWGRGSDANCNPTVGVWGDDVRPCFPPDLTLLDGTASACGFTATLLGSSNLTDQWAQYTINNITPTQEIKFIVLTNVLTLQSVSDTYTLLDDLVLTETPNPVHVSIASSVVNPSPCTGGQVTINYQLTLPPGIPTNPAPINIQALLPPGFTVVSPSNFSAGGQHTIPANGLVPGVIYPLVLTLQLDPVLVVAGTSYDVVLDVVANGSACFTSGSNSNVATITPTATLMSVNVFASDPFPNSGDGVTIYVEVCNLGATTLAGVIVEDLLPPSLFFNGSDDFTADGNLLTSQPFTLPGTLPGLPPECIVLSFKAKIAFESSCSSFENCATATYSTCAAVSGCCQFSLGTSADMELSNTNNLDAALPVNEAVGLFISISGTFTVLSNTAYTFSNCKILMQPNAEIILQPGAKLSITKESSLSGCEKLWKSITVNDGSVLTINGKSIIQDARRAIDIPATKATIQLNACILRNNYIDIYAYYNYNAEINGYIARTLFECPSPIFEYNNQTLYGLYLNRTILPPLNSCTFSDLHCGIYANASPLSVYFSRFENIQPYYPQGGGGTGIYSFTKGVVPLTVIGNPDLTVAFENCKTGIYSYNTNLYVHRVDMNNVINGVDFKITNAPNEYPTFVGTCNINCSDYGIRGQIFSPLQNPLFSSNFIRVNNTTQNPTASGVYVESDMNQSAIRVHTTTVYVDHGAYGIHLRNFLKATLYRNGFGGAQAPIELNCPNAIGLHLVNIHSGLARCNYVKEGSSMVHTTGIDVISSPNVTFECNQTDHTDVGLRISGVCNTPEKFRGNTFGSHNIGFQINPTGSLGGQKHEGNIWNGNSTLEAQHLGDPSLSPFLVANNVADFFPNPLDPPYNPFAPVNWFTPATTASSYSCDQSSTCSTLPEMFTSPGLDVTDELIASGLFGESKYEGLPWMAESYLFEKLETHPSFTSQSALFSQFASDYAHKSAGQLFTAHQGLINMADFGPDVQNYLAFIAQDYRNYANILLRTDEELLTANSTATLDALLGERAEILKSLQKRIAKAEALQASLNTSIASKAQDIRTKMGTIQPENLPEKNYRAISEMWLKSIGEGRPERLNDDFAERLQAIAQQCPYEGGWAVYWARGLYSYVDNVYYDDEELCSDAQQRNSGQTMVKAGLSLAPNPAHEYLDIFWSFAAQDAQLTILNSLQRPVYADQVSGSNFRLDVRNFQPGIYFASITRNGEKTISKPFVIVR